MTIYTPKPAEKKDEKDLPKPEIVTEPLLYADWYEKEILKPEKKDNLLNEDVLVHPTMVAVAPRRRRSNTTNFCIMITATVVLVAGIMGGIYLYRHLSHKQTYRGVCGVRFYDNDDLTGTGHFDKQRGSHFGQNWGNGDYNRGQRRQRHFGSFEEQVEVDRDGGTFEKIDVPEFEECKRATILHDFERNFTAIVDKDNVRCFIMPLNRTMVKPPRDFWDLITKLKSGYYMPDAEVVREEYQVERPPITNLRPYGYYIWRECRYFETFQLKKADPNAPVAMAKRSIQEDGKYAVFDGKNVRQFMVKGLN